MKHDFRNSSFRAVEHLPPIWFRCVWPDKAPANDQMPSWLADALWAVANGPRRRPRARHARARIADRRRELAVHG